MIKKSFSILFSRIYHLRVSDRDTSGATEPCESESVNHSIMSEDYIPTRYPLEDGVLI